MTLKSLISKFGEPFKAMEVFGTLPWQKDEFATLFGDTESEDVDFALVDKYGKLQSAYDEDEINVEYYSKLIRSIFRRRSRKWNAIAETYCQEYSIIENYDRYESLSSKTSYEGSEKDTRTDDLKQVNKLDTVDTFTKTGSEKLTSTDDTTTTNTLGSADTTTKTGTDTNQKAMGTSVLNQQSAFDTGLTDNTKTINSGSDTDTATYNTTDTTKHSGTDTTGVKGTREDTTTFTDRKDETTHQGNTSLENSGTQTNEKTFTDRQDQTTGENHIHGNIGVTTAQQMITEERQLWLDDYFDYVFNDVLKELTIPIY